MLGEEVDGVGQKRLHRLAVALRPCGVEALGHEAVKEEFPAQMVGREVVPRREAVEAVDGVRRFRRLGFSAHVRFADELRVGRVVKVVVKLQRLADVVPEGALQNVEAHRPTKRSVP